jgi:hypothetical protein
MHVHTYALLSFLPSTPSRPQLWQIIHKQITLFSLAHRIGKSILRTIEVETYQHVVFDLRFALHVLRPIIPLQASQLLVLGSICRG